jgi:hypothetical protein
MKRTHHSSSNTDATDVTRRLAPLFEKWVRECMGYTYNRKELTPDCDWEDDEPVPDESWVFNEENLQSMIRCARGVPVEESDYPDPLRFLQRMREEWPHELDRDLQQVLIDAMPVKDASHSCELCGMRIPRELVWEVGYRNGSGFRFEQSIACDTFGGTKWTCKTCADRVFEAWSQVGGILFKEEMEEFARLQEQILAELEEETEHGGAEEDYRGEFVTVVEEFHSSEEHNNYTEQCPADDYRTEVVMIGDSHREVIVID